MLNLMDLEKKHTFKEKEIRGVWFNQYNIISGIALIKHLIIFLDHLHNKYHTQNLYSIECMITVKETTLINYASYTSY